MTAKIYIQWLCQIVSFNKIRFYVFFQVDFFLGVVIRYMTFLTSKLRAHYRVGMRSLVVAQKQGVFETLV